MEADLIAFSCLTATFQWAFKIAANVRKHKKIPTVFGGIHPSAVPEITMQFTEVDFVCQGEGEVALSSLVHDLQLKKTTFVIPNIWHKNNHQIIPPPSIDKFIENLDVLPLPDKEPWSKVVRIKDNYNILTARGCPYRCTFCFNNFFAELPTQKSKYLRRRSVENVLQELSLGKERYKYKYVQFHDDIFTMDKEWLYDFLPKLKKEINIPWSCSIHSHFINADLIKLMEESGCKMMQMGIQSLDEFNYKKIILKRSEAQAKLEKLSTFLINQTYNSM